MTQQLGERRLRPLFQPIGSLATGDLLGYEALIRGPAGTPLESPAALFAEARRCGCQIELERLASRVCIAAFARAGLPGKLFLNFSADAIREVLACRQDVRRFLDEAGLPSDRIVVELTEQAATGPLDSLRDAIRVMRDGGAQFALDDYGTGHTNLSLWVELEPDYVKIDRTVVAGVARSAFRLEALRAMRQLAQVGGTALVAEGLECVDDLLVCRDLGIPHAQGFLLGRPAETPAGALTEAALQALGTNAIAVFPEPLRVLPRIFSASRLLVDAPHVTPRTRNDDVLGLFTRHPDLHALAVVEGGVPIGLINRRTFTDAYALPYHRELFGRKSCMEFVNRTPVIVDKHATMEELAALLAGQDQRYLSDGLVIVEQGRYVGLARGEDLVRAVTEVRIEAARYANPLTFLPGNMPIDAHIKRLVESGVPFHACYCDLNSFKPFNDQYGYWQGDEMLKLAAAVLGEVCEPTRDFLGHVGGDDFLVLFQSEDWETRIRRAIDQFNESAVRLYSDADVTAGGIRSEDRHGNMRFYHFVTMAVGVVPVAANSALDGDCIATLAAAAKREAKKAQSGFHIEAPGVAANPAA